MITVENKLTIYEIKGEKTGPDSPKLFVKSHWSYEDFVVLVLEVPGELGAVIDIAVSARDLHAAIANSQNTGSR